MSASAARVVERVVNTVRYPLAEPTSAHLIVCDAGDALDVRPVPGCRGAIAVDVGRGPSRRNGLRVSWTIAAVRRRHAYGGEDESAADQGTREEAHGEPPYPLPGRIVGSSATVPTPSRTSRDAAAAGSPVRPPSRVLLQDPGVLVMVQLAA